MSLDLNPHLNPYLCIKYLHILSATVLFGTGIGIAFFKWITDRTGDVRAIRIVNEEAVALFLQLLLRADERFRSGALEERARLGVEDVAEKIVCRCVADIELDGRIERRQLHQLGLTKLRALDRGSGGECLL